MNQVAKFDNSNLPPLPPQTESEAMLSMIERMASDPSIDLARLEKIMEMRRSLEEAAERRAFNAAMAACKAELPQVVKNAENSDNKARYATLDKVGEAIDAVVAKHGFSLSFNPGKCDLQGFLRIECTVAHSMGHERHYHADLPTDGTGLKGNANKTAIHAWGSTMTYGRRYLTMMIFDVKSRILTPDDDGRAAGGNSADTIGAEKALELIAIGESVHGKGGVDVEAFCRHFKVEVLPDLPVRRLNEAIAALKRKG